MIREGLLKLPAQKAARRVFARLAARSEAWESVSAANDISESWMNTAQPNKEITPIPRASATKTARSTPGGGAWKSE